MSDRQQYIADILQASLVQIDARQATVEEVIASHPEIAEELRTGLETAMWLTANGNVFDPRPGFIPASRRLIVKHIRESIQVAPARSPWVNFLARLPSGIHSLPKRKLAYRFVLVVLMAFIFVSGAWRVVSTASEALPGDLLYGVKLTVEGAELMLTLDLEQSARLHIEFAQRRLVEIQNLVLENRYDDVSDTVTRYERHMAYAISNVTLVNRLNPERAKSLLATMQANLNEQRVLLSILMGSSPPRTRAEIARAIQISEDSLNEVTNALMSASNTPFPSPSLTMQFLPTGTRGLSWARLRLLHRYHPIFQLQPAPCCPQRRRRLRRWMSLKTVKSLHLHLHLHLRQPWKPIQRKRRNRPKPKNLFQSLRVVHHEETDQNQKTSSRAYASSTQADQEAQITLRLPDNISVFVLRA